MILAAVVSLTLAQTEIQAAREALGVGSNRAAIDHCRVALDLGVPLEVVVGIMDKAEARMRESDGLKALV